MSPLVSTIRLRVGIFTDESVFCTGRLFMASLVDLSKYAELLLAMGFGAGIGMGLTLLPSTAIQAHYWHRRRPLAIGLVMAGMFDSPDERSHTLSPHFLTSLLGGPVGGVVYPLLLNHLIHGRVGYVWGVRIMAFIILGVLVLANALMIPKPSKLEPRKRPPVRELLKDFLYVILIAGYVDSDFLSSLCDLFCPALKVLTRLYMKTILCLYDMSFHW